MPTKSALATAGEAEPAETAFMDDLDIARVLRLSRSWVRKQRFLRRKGLPHLLTVDAVQIGRCPRYRAADVKAWLLVLIPAKELDHGTR